MIQFQKQQVQPPFSGYLSEGDFFQVNILTTATTTGLTLAGRILAPNGSVNKLQYNLDGVATSTFTTKILPASEGFLVSLSVTALNSGLADQACFVAVGLQSGSNAGLAPHTMLAHGYVSNLNTLEWPAVFSRVQSGGGQTFTPQSIQVTNPAAGADWAYTVPANTTYTLKSLAYTYSAVVGGATRYSLLEITDGSNRLYLSDVSLLQSPPSTFNYAAGSGVCDTLANPNVAMPLMLFDPVLAAGWVVKAHTLNIQPGDQYSNISLAVLKWN